MSVTLHATCYMLAVSVSPLFWCRSSSKVETTVEDNSDGTYSVSYTPDEAGVYSVWVCVGAQHVQVRPACLGI